MALPVVVAIGSTAPSAALGLSRDLGLGPQLLVEVRPVVAAVTAQGPTGVVAVYPQPLEAIEAQIAAALADGRAAAIHIGLLPEPELIEVVAATLADVTLPRVVDPVIGASTGEAFLQGQGIDLLRKALVPGSILTPNIPEAVALIGKPIADRGGMERAAEALLAAGAQAVLLKGGHLEGPTVIDLLSTPSGHLALPMPLVMSGGSVRGSGDALAAALAASLASGLRLPQAARRAQRFVHHQVLQPEAERLHYSAATDAAVSRWCQGFALLQLLLPAHAVPQVASNMAYLYAPQPGEIAVLGLAGRLTIAGEDIATSGTPTVEGPHHTGRLVRVLHELDSSACCVLNVRFNEEAIATGRSMGLLVEGFDRAQEPQGTPSTMEWGTRNVISRIGRAPDVLYDRGGPGKEPMLRIIGPDPVEVATLVGRLFGTGGDPWA